MGCCPVSCLISVTQGVTSGYQLVTIGLPNEQLNMAYQWLPIGLPTAVGKLPVPELASRLL